MFTRNYFKVVEYHSNEVSGQPMQAEILNPPIFIEMTESQSSEDTKFRIYGLRDKFIKNEFSFERRQYQNNTWESLMYYSSIPEITQDFDEFVNLRKFYPPPTNHILPNQPYECTAFFNHSKEITSIKFKLFTGSRRLLIELRNSDLPMNIRIDSIVIAEELIKRLQRQERIEIRELKNLFSGSDFSFTKINALNAVDFSNALLNYYKLDSDKLSEEADIEFIKVIEGGFFQFDKKNLSKEKVIESCLDRLKFSIDEYYSSEDEL